MAATEASAAFGIVLKKGGAAVGDAYTDYGLEIIDVGIPGWVREAVDVSHHASPNGWGEVIMAGVRRLQPFSVTINWIPGNTGDLKSEIEGAPVFWKIEFPDTDTSSVAFKAGVTGFEFDGATPDGKLGATITFTPSGEPTWA